MRRFLMILSVLMLSFTLVACGGGEMSHDSHDGNGEGHEESQGDEDRIPNDGRVVRIVSPTNGDTFAAGQEVEIRIEFENFEMVDGAHWHYRIDDDVSGKMIMNGMDDRIRDLEPGEHSISVFIAGGDHIEFEDGDRVMITVEE